MTPSFPVIATIVVATFASIIAQPARAQLTWDATGLPATPGLDIGGNWVGGVAPNLTSATTNSAIFSASTNTAVKLRNVTTGDFFPTVTFDASAPAYTFTSSTVDYNGNGIVDAADYVLWRNNPAGFGGNPAGYDAWRSAFGTSGKNELVILPAGNITNNSGSTQTMTGIGAVTLNGAVALGAGMVASLGDGGTNLSFDVSQIKFSNPTLQTASGGGANSTYVDLTGGYDVRTSTIKGLVNGGITSSLYVQGDPVYGIPGNPSGGTPAGRLFITGDSGTNSGRIVVDIGGIVRISNNNALGDGTGVDNVTRLTGSYDDGRVELTGGITTNEAFTLEARQYGEGYAAPALLSVSGNNTLTGIFRWSGGGNAYNFGAEAGATLTIQSNLAVSTSFERYIQFQHAGNIVVNGNIQDSNTGTGTAAPDVTLENVDSTTTINGSANSKIGHLYIRGGTLALGASAGITWANHSTDINDPDTIAQPEGLQSRVIINAGGTFDVTAIAGGYNLTQTLQGSGTVKGQINMASGTRVRPGDIVQSNGYGITVLGFVHPDGGTDFVGVGSVTFGGAGSGLNMSAGSILVWQLAALSTTTPGMDFDQVVVGGNLALGGTSSLNLDFTLTSLGAADPNSGDPFWTSNHSWKIIDTNTNIGNTNFASITNGTWSLGHFATSVGAGADAGDIFLNYTAPGSGSGLGGGAVPEPATLMLVVFGALGALLVRKR